MTVDMYEYNHSDLMIELEPLGYTGYDSPKEMLKWIRNRCDVEILIDREPTGYMVLIVDAEGYSLSVAPDGLIFDDVIDRTYILDERKYSNRADAEEGAVRMCIDLIKRRVIQVYN